MPYIKEVCMAGRTIEIRKYYSIRWHTEGIPRAERQEPSSEKQKIMNRRKAERDLTRILNANFVDGDYWVRLDFYKVKPEGSLEMQELTAKAFRRMRTLYRKAGLEIRYVYCKEIGPKGSRHVHAVISKGDLDLIREAWPYGGVHVDPLYSEGQYRRIAEYMVKYSARTEATEGQLIGKRWYGSRSLVKPKVTKEKISAKAFRTTPSIPKRLLRQGYQLEKDSERAGISELTGFPFYQYTLIRYDKEERDAGEHLHLSDAPGRTQKRRRSLCPRGSLGKDDPDDGDGNDAL